MCEGLETGLALLQHGGPGVHCVWAFGSAGAIARFPVIFGVGQLVIFADNDANEAGMKGAIECWIAGRPNLPGFTAVICVLHQAPRPRRH